MRPVVAPAPACPRSQAWAGAAPGGVGVRAPRARSDFRNENDMWYREAAELSSTAQPINDKPACEMPAELNRPFRILAFDWDGTAVANRQEDAGPVRGVLSDVLRRGTVVPIITGTDFPNGDRQLTAAVRGAHQRRL